ncbi:hypothetical protein ASE99_23905 [Serratia sp. Leaf51]|nr:hypothetical protein ASE99_23905 [Serratia sp. Leaf51]
MYPPSLALKWFTEFGHLNRDVGLSTMTKWVKQLRDERQAKTPKTSQITPEQIERRELKRKLQGIEKENKILKKATAL